MFPPIRKYRNRKIQILFAVEGRDAAGAVELLSVILRRICIYDERRGEPGRLLSFAVRKKLPGERKLFIEVV